MAPLAYRIYGFRLLHTLVIPGESIGNPLLLSSHLRVLSLFFLYTESYYVLRGVVLSLHTVSCIRISTVRVPYTVRGAFAVSCDTVRLTPRGSVDSGDRLRREQSRWCQARECAVVGAVGVAATAAAAVALEEAEAVAVEELEAAAVGVAVEVAAEVAPAPQYLVAVPRLPPGSSPARARAPPLAPRAC